MVSFRIRGELRESKAFLSALKIFTLAERSADDARNKCKEKNKEKEIKKERKRLEKEKGREREKLSKRIDAEV